MDDFELPDGIVKGDWNIRTNGFNGEMKGEMNVRGAGEKDVAGSRR